MRFGLLTGLTTHLGQLAGLTTIGAAYWELPQATLDFFLERSGPPPTRAP